MYLYRYLNETEQQHIFHLLQFITQFKPAQDQFDPGSSQLDLWNSFDSYVNTMPGFWSVFSKLRPLSRLLKLTLNEFAPADLRQQDTLLSLAVIATLKTNLDTLLTKFNALMVQFKELKNENDALKKLVEQGLVSLESAEKESKDKYDALMKEKESLSQEFNSLGERYDQITQKWGDLKTQATRLLTNNRFLKQENAALHNQLQRSNTALEMSVIKLKESEQFIDDLASQYSGVRAENVSVADVEKINEQFRRYRNNRQSVVLFPNSTTIKDKEPRSSLRHSVR